MSNINYLEFAETLVQYGRKNGADQMQVSINRSNNFSVDVRNQQIEKLTEAGSSSLALKIIIDSRVATASSSDFSLSTLQELIKDTIKRAKISGSDPYSALPEKESITAHEDQLKLYDPSVETISPESKINYARELEKIGMADKRIKVSGGASYSTGTGERMLANSNGFSNSYKYSHCSAGLSLQAGEGENQFEDGWYESSIKYGSIPAAEYIAKKAIDRTTRLLGAIKVQTQKVPVIFEPNMTSSLLGFLAQCLNGNAIYMSQSFLKDKLNQKIGSDLVNIIDDGTLPGLLGSKPFDGEGVPTRKNIIFQGGVLKSYLLNSYAARKLKLKSTGNASGANNFILQAGNSSIEEMIKSIDNGLLLTNTIGQGTVATTGDYSKGAYGIWIEKGKLAYPVAEITINGNLAQMLADIEMLGSDLDYRRPVTGPSIKIKEMSVSGK